MINQVKYKSNTLSYESGEIYVNGKLDKTDTWKPSFVDNGPNDEPTFIGFTNTKTNEFVSLSGKIFKTILPEDIDL